MSILVKKLQQGGGIFANPAGMDLGARSLMGLIGPAQSGRASTAGSDIKQLNPSRKSQTNTTNAIKDGLQSDVKYFKLKRKEIDTGIKELMIDGIDNDEKAEYDRLIQARYDLEAIDKPQIKSLFKLHSSTKKHFEKEDAGSMPAIIGGKAFIYDATDEENPYKVISESALLKNPKKFMVLTASDILSKRETDARFSGFTKLGNDATSFLDNLYGEDSFLTHLNKQLSQTGYIKYDGFILGEDRKKIIPSNISEKSNIPQIRSLISNMSKNVTSNQYQYLRSRAVYDIYRSASTDGGIKTSNKTDEEVANLIRDAYQSNLARSIKQAVVKDMKFKEGDGPNNTGGPSGKDKKYNVFSLAVGTIGKNNEIIEVPFDRKNDKAASLLYVSKAAYIDNGSRVLESGYSADKTLTPDTPSKRILSNNIVIKNMLAGKGIISTIDGKDIEKLVGKKENITTPTDTNLHVVLAPIETIHRKDVVNFDNKHAQAIAAVTSVIYDLWKKNGIDPVDIISDPAVKQKAEAIAKDALDKYLGENGIKSPPNLRLGIAASFDVAYLAEGELKYYKYQWEAGGTDVETVKANDDSNMFLYDTYKRTKVFVPISDSFFSNMKASNYFDETYKRTFSPAAAESALTESSTVSKTVDYSNISKSMASKRFNEAYEGVISEKHGGKLATADDLLKLIL